MAELRITGFETLNDNYLIVAKEDEVIVDMFYMNSDGSIERSIEPSQFQKEYAFAKTWPNSEEKKAVGDIRKKIDKCLGKLAEVAEIKPATQSPFANLGALLGH